jgi:hypothetical protein
MDDESDATKGIGRNSKGLFKIPVTPAESQANNNISSSNNVDANSIEGGIPLILPKKWPQQSTILAQLEGATLQNIQNQSGALGRLRVDGQHILLDINGERYSGPLCPTVTCMIVNMTKDEGKITSMVSDYCPMNHEINVLGNVRGKVTRGERDEEDHEEENKKRKLEEANSNKNNKKKKKKRRKKR